MYSTALAMANTLCNTPPRINLHTNICIKALAMAITFYIAPLPTNPRTVVHAFICVIARILFANMKRLGISPVRLEASILSTGHVDASNAVK